MTLNAGARGQGPGASTRAGIIFLLLSTVYFLPSTVFGVIAVVNGHSEAGGSTGVTSFSTTTGISVTTGNALVVTCTGSGNPLNETSITDTASNTFTKQVSVDNWNASGASSDMFVALNVTGNASDKFTCNYSATATFPTFSVVQYSGVATSAAVDVADATATCSACTTATSGSFSTAVANEVIVVFSGQNQNPTWTPGTGYTNETSIGGQLMEDKIVSSTQSAVTASATSSLSGNMVIEVLSLEAAAGVSCGGSSAIALLGVGCR